MSNSLLLFIAGLATGQFSFLRALILFHREEADLMSDWFAGIKNKANEVACGGQGVIKSSMLTQEERAVLDLKYPPHTGKAAVRPFVIWWTVE